ncbi:MAG: F0F1 ATP synthase subunit gamma [Prevotellaceae bacterium]|jgi:F-type H+-transporting ATPase subunit gamma|nr:F0F1 ATP synthase subunit gamma [Prevotellaceae bacterium]
MSSLKEIKGRIHSVKSTQKITSAMKMVSSAKLRKAQRIVENFLPYENKINALLQNFLNAEDSVVVSPLAETREVKRVAIVAVSSNSSLCGSFNANVIRKLEQRAEYYHYLGNNNILIYPVGKKIQKACSKMGFTPQCDLETLIDKPDYEGAARLAGELLRLFLKKEVDNVELIYHHFHSRSSQVLKNEVFLPVDLQQSGKNNAHSVNYIVEPDRETIIEELIPKALRLKMYASLLDSSASEHAARTIAMQMATENANDLLQELSLQYNKSRQQAITNELLDIIGASFGMN